MVPSLTLLNKLEILYWGINCLYGNIFLFTDIISFVAISKNLYRLDLDRLLIVQAKSPELHFISLFKIFSVLPSDSDQSVSSEAAF